MSPSSTLTTCACAREADATKRALDARAIEQLAGRAVDRLARDPGDRGRQRLEVLGKPLLEPRGDVHVCVELLDHGRGKLILDVRVGDQLLGRLAEGLGIERLALDPVREQADDEEHDADDDECSCGHDAAA